ncbi:MAG TPA: hypothetical protein O0W92_01225 [Methanocorpusculum sp.]|nr:hypothetical protein [Methanocorpusculum sp.]
MMKGELIWMFLSVMLPDAIACFSGKYTIACLYNMVQCDETICK